MSGRVLDPSTRLLLVVVLVFAVGADFGCVMSGNFVGAATWSFVALCIGLTLVVTRPVAPR
jgi:hypothetical protein